MGNSNDFCLRHVENIELDIFKVGQNYIIFHFGDDNKRTVVVQSSAALNNGIINYEGNNKKFVPDQTSLSNKRDGNTIKVK